MTYEYTCTACGHNFEAEQKITDHPIATCPKCDQDKVKRLISGGAGFQLLGKGWFKDGY